MSPPQEDPAEVAVWALLGILYYFAMGAVAAALALLLGYLLADVVPFIIVLTPVAFFGVPIYLYVKRIPKLAPERAEGFRIGLWLFLGIVILFPAVICSGIL